VVAAELACNSFSRGWHKVDGATTS